MEDPEAQRNTRRNRAERYDDFDDRRTRHAFVRKVFMIVGAQLLVTFSFVFLCMSVDDIKLFVQARSNAWIFWVCIGVTMVLMLVFGYFESARKKSPLNIILLIIFTFAESYVVAYSSSFKYTDVVLIAFGVTVVLCSTLILFALQIKWDFTGMAPFMLIFVVILLVMSIVSIFWRNRIFLIVICSFGIFIFSVYLIIDVQMMLGGKHKYQFDPEDYIGAAVSIYIDIITLFLYILELMGLVCND